MSDTLRDNIISALLPLRCHLEEPCEECRIWVAQDADAVIEALRLHPVEGTVSRFEGRTYRRYITDWTPDE